VTLRREPMFRNSECSWTLCYPISAYSRLISPHNWHIFIQKESRVSKYEFGRSQALFGQSLTCDCWILPAQGPLLRSVRTFCCSTLLVHFSCPQILEPIPILNFDDAISGTWLQRRRARVKPVAQPASCCIFFSSPFFSCTMSGKASFPDLLEALKSAPTAPEATAAAGSIAQAVRAQGLATLRWACCPVDAALADYNV